MNRYFYIIVSILLLSISGCGEGGTEKIDTNDTQSKMVNVQFPSYKEFACTKEPNAQSVVFCIDSNDSYTSIGKDATSEESLLLEKILQTFPRRMRERVVQIEFEEADASEGSAAVSPIDEKKVHWEIWINTNKELDNEDDPLEKTIAHELMHYLTLNSTQAGTNRDICGEVIGVLDGCPARDSLYFDYIQTFWINIYKKEIWESEDGDYNVYYEEHQDDFVTPYAVTNPGEDIAEAFSFFLFEQRPEDLSLIKNQKIDYFWKFPEMRHLREEIQENLSKQTAHTL